MAGIGRDRVHLRWVSSAEGKLFADYVTQVSGTIAELGTFDAVVQKLPLAAVKRTLETPRVRWLLGMERELVEHQNVYGDKVDADRYHDLFQAVLTHEYNKSLLLETLSETEGRQIRQLAEETGLDLQTISRCLVELEKGGLAELEGYEGQHPKFVRQAA